MAMAWSSCQGTCFRRWRATFKVKKLTRLTASKDPSNNPVSSSRCACSARQPGSRTPVLIAACMQQTFLALLLCRLWAVWQGVQAAGPGPHREAESSQQVHSSRRAAGVQGQCRCWRPRQQGGPARAAAPAGVQPGCSHDCRAAAGAAGDGPGEGAGEGDSFKFVTVLSRYTRFSLKTARHMCGSSGRCSWCVSEDSLGVCRSLVTLLLVSHSSAPLLAF